jgi:hypothetical protein
MDGDGPEQSGQRSTVTLIIPNWNGLAHLDVCLTSIGRQSLRPGETIVVDNGSTDGSVDFIRGRFPWVTLICLPENRGFAAAVNTGIRAATGQFVALLNNDTELDTGWLAALVEPVHADDRVAAVACRMLAFERRTTLDSAGDMLTRTGVPFTRGYGQPDDGKYRTTEEVFGPCAGAALYRKDAILCVGGFDEDYISYYEDVDLSFRLQLAGKKCLYVPEAVCYHKRNATGSLVTGYPLKMQERNLLLFYCKNFPLQILLARGVLIIAGYLRRYWIYQRAGVVRTAWEGLREGARLVPLMIRKRRSVRALRTVPIGHLRRFLVRKESA